MRVIHRLVGYDSQTDKTKISLDIPDRLLTEAKKIVRVPDDDPEALWSYPLSVDQARAVAKLTGVEIDPATAEFFLEAFADPLPVGQARRRSRSMAGD
jgi:hypothetical protein